MLIKYRLMAEQEEGGEGGGGHEDRTAEFNAIIDQREREREQENESVTVTDAVKRGDVKTETSKTDDNVSVTGTDEAKDSSITYTEDENFLTDELRNLGGTYGFSDEMMLNQGSEAALRNAMLLVDQYEKRQLDLHRGQQRPQPDPSGEENTEEVPPVQQPNETKADFAARMAILQEEGYDEPITNMFNEQHQENQFLKQKIEQMEAQMSQFQQHADHVQQGARTNYQNQVLNLVDSLNREDLFGNKHTATDEQHENIRQVEMEVQDLMQRQGQRLDSATITRAFNRVFADKLIHESRSNKSKALQNQSRRRMGSGNPSQPRHDIEWDGPLDEHPGLLAMGNRFLQENRGL